jgi:hypothetical protein
MSPHPGSILNRNPFEQYRNQISRNHIITIDTADRAFADCASMSNKPAGISHFTSSFSAAVVTPPPLRILFVEPDPDLQQVYGIWLYSMGYNAIITDSGKKCLDEVLKATYKGEGKDKNKNEGFDLVILDTHLNDIPLSPSRQKDHRRKSRPEDYSQIRCLPLLSKRTLLTRLVVLIITIYS